MFTRSTSVGGNYTFNQSHLNPNSFLSGGNSYNQQNKYQPDMTMKSSGVSVNESFKPAINSPLHQSTQNLQQQPQEPPPQQQTQEPQQQQQQKQQSQHLEQRELSSKPGYLGSGQVQQNQQISQPLRLKPILKQSAPLPLLNDSVPSPIPTVQSIAPETSSILSQEHLNLVYLDDDNNISVEQKDLSRWKRTKIPGNKVNRKLKRLRLNQRLRKTLMPKNAIMVLNEMKAGVQFTFPENQSMLNSLFLVHAELDGKTYIGQGLSKPLARQNAAENALKSLLLEKMTAAAMKNKMDEDNESNQSMKESESDISLIEMNNSDEPDEIPWSSLASFALYKLFLEWQNQGTVVPIPRPGMQQLIKSKTEPKAPLEKKLPPNATSIHPVMLLNQMRPGIVYTEVNRVGNPPNTLFTLSVEINGEVFLGEAKNKKDAKKVAAKNALKALFELEYPIDDSNTSQQMELNE